MKKIFIALLIGIIAGIIDAIPMVIMDLSWYATLSAFMHWVVLGLIIPFVSWKNPDWLKGLLLAELFAIPTAIYIFPIEAESIPVILLSSALLGTLVGWSGRKFVVSGGFSTS
jgi:hypothetical protein